MNQTLIILIVLGCVVNAFVLGYTMRSKKIKALEQENNGLRAIPEFEIDTANGIMKIREAEWPYNAEEYLEYHSLTRDGGTIEISYIGLESHLNAFAGHVASKQKRDVMKTLNAVKHGKEVIRILNWKE